MAKPEPKKKKWTRLDALTVREYEKDGETRSVWTRIGSAFVGEDGNIQVALDALPVTGKIHLRKPLPKEDE